MFLNHDLDKNVDVLDELGCGSLPLADPYSLSLKSPSEGPQACSFRCMGRAVLQDVLRCVRGSWTPVPHGKDMT